MESAERKARFSVTRADALAATSLCVLLCASASTRANGLPWEIWESPSRIATLDAGDVVLERSSHCLDGCRYDRSNAGAESPADNPYPLRWIYRDGDEDILFDEPGPGAITRLWMTTGFGVSTCIDPAIRARFYFDGASTPTLDVPLAALFDGSTPPFTPPLVADRASSSGGFVSEVPIAYSRSLRIALVGADDGGTNPCTGSDERLLWFQIQHHGLAPGADVASFAPGDDFPAWRSFLMHAGADPWNAMLAPIEATSTLEPGARVDLATRAGPGWLRGIRLRLPRENYGVRLHVVIDGAVAVDLPLEDFFAMPRDAMAPAGGVFAGEDASGWLYAWLPMPFRDSIDVALVADDALAAPVSIESALSFDAEPVAADAASYVARVSDGCASQGSLALYSDDGAGRIVGVASRAWPVQAGDLGYLEGDERAVFDGATAPGWYGTGVEDFFDGGFYFDAGPFALPFAGATIVDPDDGSGTTASYRWMATDPLVYSAGVRVGREAGFSPSQPVPTCARSVVHAYRTRQPIVVGYDRFDVGTAAADAHSYAPPDNATCEVANGTFEDEPPTTRSASVCTYTAGSSRFTFDVGDAAPPLRLRRTIDVASGSPGETAGVPAADILVDGGVVGRFPAAIGNPLRRWSEQEALLDRRLGAGRHVFEIVPEFATFAPRNSESAFALSGGWKDAIFGDGFEFRSP
jgi:hypothetical protein